MTESANHNAPLNIALTCPGGQITRELAEKAAQIAAARFDDSVKLHFHPQCFSMSGRFAESGAEQSAAFLEVANDPTYDAVWFASGAYGACRLDPSLFAQLNDHARAKTYLGHGENATLLARLYKQQIGRPVHGPVPTDLTHDGGEAAIERALDFLVNGDATTLEPTVASGKKLAAFNMTALAHLATDWMPDLSGHIIMLEEDGEYLYRTDRAMFAITANKLVKNAAGIMLGRVSAIPENDRPFGKSEEEIVKDWCARSNIPYLGRADIGHDAVNKIVPFGAFNAA